MSLFDDAWSGAVAESLSTAGQPIVLNGFDTVANVSTVTSTTRRVSGLRVVDNSTIIHVSRDAFEQSGCAKGSIAVIGGRRARVMSCSDLGGAGWELAAESVENSKGIPGAR